MKHLLGAVLAGCLILFAAAGCSDRQEANRKQFEDLYKEYSDRFHEKMATQAGSLNPAQVAAEAARMWNNIFDGHKDIVRRRAEDVLRDLRDAPAINEKEYNQVVQASPPEKEEEGLVLKQFLWNPIGAAQDYLNTLFANVLQPADQTRQAVLTSHAAIFWLAIDRNPERPKLMLRQGPWVFLVELSRRDDYYHADKLRWLQHVSMGSIRVEGAPGAPGKPSGSSGAGTPPKAPETPSKAPETPPKGPAKGPQG
ncbi:MAG: hypothetical protein NTX40_02195 [Planctomycetota bacterium]|nr:hypothetical protein [Planctomycetota bacterium]